MRVGAKLFIDARTLKTLIVHLSTRIYLVQYFCSFFHFYLKIMRFLQTKLNRYEINSKKLHESLILIISYQRPHIQHFFTSSHI